MNETLDKLKIDPTWAKAGIDWSDIIDCVWSAPEEKLYLTHKGKTYSYKEYLCRGKPHREDGPAVEWSDGYKEFYLEGKLVTEAEIKK